MYDIKISSLLPKLYENIDRLVESGSLKNKNIYVFGKGIWGFAVTQYLHTKGIDISCVLDNNMQKKEWSTTASQSVFSDSEYKVKFALPEQVLGKYEEKAFVLISSRFYESQSKQLMKMGYQEGIHFIKLDKSYYIPVEKKPTDITELDSETIKEYLFDLLKFFKKICEENHLTYYLTEGTLLGAVRHKGFIPWDDDIDVSMPLKDYMKLHEIFRKNKYAFGKYSLYSMVDDDSCMYAYAKLMNTNTLLHLEKYPMDVITHVCIDIFPLSGVPLLEEEESKIFLRDLDDFNSRWMKYRSYVGMDIYPFENCKEEWYELLTRYDYDTSKGISYIFAEYPNFRICDKKLYDHTVNLEYEGELFTTISGYKEYLEIAYGDYMTPPANWQQFGKHSYMDCWVDNSLEDQEKEIKE